MTHFVYTVKWHIGNVINKPSRKNAPTDRVLTSVILKRIEWAFRKVYPTKIPGMVHQYLLAPQSLMVELSWKSNIANKSSTKYINADVFKVGASHHVWSTVRNNVHDSRRAQIRCR